MSYFTDSSEVYETLGELLSELAESGGLGTQLAATNTTVQLAFVEPQASVTLVFAEGQDPEVVFGATSLTPDVILRMSADTGHELFLGRITLMGARLRGEVVVEGPAPTLLPLWPPIIYAAASRYAQMLNSAGRGDLAGV